MESLWLRFMLALLATWRVTHLIAYEDGPADLMVKLRRRLGAGFFGQLMDCFKCLSLWVAVPFTFAIARGPLEWVLAWLALSGGACLLERLGREPVTIQEMPSPRGGDDDAVLRTEASGTAESATGNDPSGDFRRGVTGPDR
jgi:hypothetical protein